MKKILQFQVVDVTPFWKRLFTSHLEVNIFGLSEDGQILLVQGGETKGTEFIPDPDEKDIVIYKNSITEDQDENRTV